ncbi:MAG: glycosyltransferase family 4 protein [Pseudomonadota bacterium]
MRVAFYAPMKSPHAATPSGDREIARRLIAALENAGHLVDVASELRSFDGTGDDARQRAIATDAAADADRYLLAVEAGARPMPDVWFTYHCYHKAPDHLGPRLGAALGVPYVIAEASVAPRRASGRWAQGYAAAHQAIACADLIIGLNPRDEPGVRAVMKPGANYEHMPPFIDAASFGRTADQREALRRQLSAEVGLPCDVAWILSVAMMRPGDKVASYKKLAEALRQLSDDLPPWRLLVVGDGDAKAEVVDAFAPLGDQVCWLGARNGGALAEIYAAADIFAWPAVNEALGMVFLEAGASGLPVVAGYTDGVASIVRDGETGLIAPMGDVSAFAEALAELIISPAMRGRLGAEASRHVRAQHNVAAAAGRLDGLLRDLKRGGRG